MKKIMNNFVFAGIMSAGFSCMASAAFAGETPGTKGIDPSVEATLLVSEDHNKQMDELNREKELLELQATLAKLQLDKEKTDVDIKKLKGIAVPVAPVQAQESSASNPIPSMPGVDAFMAPPSQAQQPQHKAVKDNPLDRIYVTRVYGVGGVRTVTAYFDNGIFTGVVGDEIVTGLKIAKVTDNGAVFSYNGKTKSVNLTTQGLAYSRSQVKQKEVKSEVSAQRMGANGFMPNMAQEITGSNNIPPPHPR